MLGLVKFDSSKFKQLTYGKKSDPKKRVTRDLNITTPKHSANAGTSRIAKLADLGDANKSKDPQAQQDENPRKRKTSQNETVTNHEFAPSKKVHSTIQEGPDSLTALTDIQTLKCDKRVKKTEDLKKI